jgi:hypothetical protein
MFMHRRAASTRAGPHARAPVRCNGLPYSRYLPNYLGWRRGLDGNRITSAEQLLRIAVGVIHSER